MRRILLSLGGLMLLTAVLSAAEVTVTGIVSDASCRMDHHGRSAEECTRSCAEEAGSYVLVVDSRIITLVAEGQAKAALWDLAGSRATVTGERGAGDVITVTKVTRPR